MLLPWGGSGCWLSLGPSCGSNALVCGPTTPSILRLLRNWNSITRASVSAPNCPSVERRGNRVGPAKLSAVWICVTTGPLSPYLRFCIEEDELTTECYTIKGGQILHLWAIFGSGSGFGFRARWKPN